MGDLLNPWGLAQVRVHDRLVLPEGMKIAGGRYAARHRLDPRPAPIQSGECNRDVDNAVSRMVIGSIVATYVPGAKGNVLAHFKDDKGRRWGLVAIDRASAALCSESKLGIEVGWIRLD